MPRESAVLTRIDAMTDEIVAFLQELTRIPTVNPPGENYVECAHAIGNKLAKFGYNVQYLEAEGRPEHTTQHPRVNVIGRMAGASTRPLLHFNGHFDVVPAGDGWTVDPFGALLRDGKIYGRGTADQKAGIAASIFAVEAMRREGVMLHGTIEQSGTVDEESGGFAGVAWLAERGYIARDRTDFVIITEPLNVDRVCLGHRGVYWFKVATLGRIAHGSMPFLGVNAIGQMGAFLAAIEHELKPSLAQRITMMPVEPPAARHPSININSISGGQPEGGMQTPCVADRCEAIFDRRYLMEEPIDEVRGEIEQILHRLAERDDEFRYRIEDLMTVPPVLTDASSPLVTTMARAVEDVIGAVPPLIASPGTYDQKHVTRLGLVDQCIAYGPGLLHLAHQPDEYCRVDHLVSAAKAMALAAMRLVG
ncbi:MAG TPA: acetylornithine deacetylase/succinyl-diaminopimelate desuccinylase family protein [Bryobacteraceae bacterium]|jgi:succinyl-diaminopimelate desuccinylase|nr:acetylornithine deacetylase/succinyl-diaminopimelate desuccinylase family protein [Bryobacteraceae bacterium]